MNRQLHSRYNPQGEAERYIGSLSLNKTIRFFILIEPGLGYLCAALKKRFPAAKVIALHAGKPEGPVCPPDAGWHPGAGISVQDFLEREIPDSPAAEIRLVEWRPALALYGRSYLSLVEETTDFIKRSDANDRTLKAFGKTWFRNFFKNLDVLRTVVCFPAPAGQTQRLPPRHPPFSLPMLVTGAGPGLEDAISRIRALKKDAARGGLFILASASSAAALEAENIIPAMVISTDGGGWARYHLHERYRGGNRSTPLAAALYAALPSQSGPILPISDGSLWQTLVLKELGIPFISLPQRGTVSASALDLAFSLTSGEIYIAGMDLAVKDIRAHARPYGLDFLMEEKAGRLSPLYSQVFRRSSLLEAGGSFRVYASWFEKQLSSYPKPPRTLGNNNPLFGAVNAAPLDAMPLDAAPETDNAAFNTVFNAVTLKAGAGFSKQALAFLEKALAGPEHSARLREELSPLLFGGGALPSLDDLIKALHTLSGPGGNRWEGGSPRHG